MTKIDELLYEIQSLNKMRKELRPKKIELKIVLPMNGLIWKSIGRIKNE